MKELKLIIGNKNYSSWSLRPWIWLQQHQIPFEEIRVPLYTKDTDSHLACYDSDHKVPILINEKIQIWDTLAILEYLAELYPEKSAYPEDINTRAIARSMCAEMHSSFMAVRSEMPMNCRRQPGKIELTPEAYKEIDRIQNVWAMARHNSEVSGGWLFGRFGLVDAMFAPVVMRFHSYKIELDAKAKDYVNMVLQQPAVKLWVEDSIKEVEVIESEER